LHFENCFVGTVRGEEARKVHSSDASTGANMDCNKHEFGSRSVAVRGQTDDMQSSDELKRFQEDVLRAIEPLQDQTSPEAGVRPSWPMMSIYQHQSSLPPSPKQKSFVLRAMIVIVVSVAISAMSIAADTERVTLAGLSVNGWLTQLTETVLDAVKNDGAPIILNDTTAQAEPAPLSSQIPTTEVPYGAVPDYSTSLQTTSSSDGSVQSADLMQPTVATSDYGEGSPSGKDENASSKINEGAPVAVNVNASSSVSLPKKNDSALYREFIEWQANQEKPQVQQHRSARFSKRTAGTRTSRKYHANATNEIVNGPSVSSRVNEHVARSNSMDVGDLVRRSARAGGAKQAE
jgi:hypothetical protein